METVELSECTYAHIKDTFYYGLFGDFKLVIDQKTGYFNATKLCSDGGKEYKKWGRLEKSKKMIEYYKKNWGPDLDSKFLYEVKGANKDKIDKQVTGTYVPKELILDIASWISVEFYDKCKICIEKINMVNIDLNQETMVDIFTFIKNKNVNIDVNSSWFQELWYPLSKKRGILGSTPLFEWMGYEGEYKLQKQRFKKLLDNNNIPYEEIDHKDQRFLEHPSMKRELVKRINEGNLVQKRWIVMDVRNFKKAVMRLNTKNSEMIRDYYLNLEEACFEYAEYQATWLKNKAEKELSKNRSLLAIKDNELKAKDKELEDRNKHVLLLKDLLVDDTKREKLQVVYISTSRNYAMQNRSKPGGVDREGLLRSRLSTYNSRSAVGDESFFYEWFFVADYKQVESRLKDVLGRFRDKKNKEMYVLHLSHMVYVVKYICEHYNDEVDEVNSKLAEFIAGFDSHHLRPWVPDPKPLPPTSQEAVIRTTGEDGAQTITTIQADTRDEFKAKLEEYILKLDSTITSISKKKVFDDLEVKKDRLQKLPILQQLLRQFRPEIKLLRSFRS